MGKIADLVDIKVSYANYVNLVDEFGDPDQNRVRLGGYMPIEAHRVAFEGLAHLCLPKDDRVYLLLGTYGTGKSHLLLMLANYLARAPHEPEMTALYANWSQQDADQAAKLRNWRGAERYLVALADFGKGGDFESMVLRAIEAACAREEYDGYLETHYGEAIRRLRAWQEQEAQGGPSGAFHDFGERLAWHYPGVTQEALIEALESYDTEAMEQFRHAYHEALGIDFAANADNLVDILEAFVGAKAFQDRYRGLVILADEFGYCLDHGNLRIDVFHRFSELCRQGIGSASLAFIGTGHRASLQAYAGAGYSEADIGVLADRIEAVGLRSEGIEKIIAAVVVPRKDCPLWGEQVSPHTSTLNKLSSDCLAAGIFRDLPGPQRREEIIEAIYPMHPMATHCAIQLATIVGSAARSLFTFFAGKANVLEEGSYPWFVANREITADGGLQLYTADLLATYFRDELQPDNLQTRPVVRDEVRNYGASMRLAEELAARESLLEIDPLIARILDLVLVFRITGVVAAEENILFGLHTPTIVEESRVQNALAKLRNDQVLFLNPTTEAYEFRIAGAGRDISQYIEAYLEDVGRHPKDLARAVVETEALKADDLWLEASAHNQPHNEDKRLLRTFALPADVERDGYIQDLEQAMLQESGWRKRYEGVAVYVLCESTSDVERARRAAAGNSSRYVVLGIPDEPIPIRQQLLKLLAALYVGEHENLDEWSEQERIRLSRDFVGDRTKGFTGEFLRQRDRYLQAKELSWIGAGGQMLVAQPSAPHEPASALMAHLYGKRNTQSHFDLNQIHVRFGPKHNMPLVDAVNDLVRTYSPLVVDTNLSASTGDIRYLRNALASCDVLVQVGKASGSQVTYRVQMDRSKFATAYPALADMMHELQSVQPGSGVPVRQLVEKYARDPYGQGPYALALFLALAIRALGDSLQLKWSPNEWGAVMVTDAEQVFGLVDGARPNAVLEYRKITDTERKFINEIFRLFSEDPGPAGRDHSLGEAYGALRHWWEQQTNLARAFSIYGSQETLATASFVQKMTQAEGTSARHFVLGELQTAFGLAADDALTTSNLPGVIDGLKTAKAQMHEQPVRLKRELLEQLMKFFSPPSDVYGDYRDAIEAWYKTLEPYQRDRYAYPSTQQQAPALLELLPKISNIEDTFWRDLPSSAGFGLGTVDDWTLDRSQEYVTKFGQALQAIANLRPPVPDPKWQVEGKQVKATQHARSAEVEFRGRVQLKVRVPPKVSQVFVSSDGGDPRQADAQRVSITDEWEETITKDRSIKMASRTADGEYGRVVEVGFRNLDLIYQVRPVLQPKLCKEREFSFTLPEDSAGLGMTFESLIEAALEHSKVDRKQLAALLRALLDKYGE